MTFNKNACKRLSIIAGIERESFQVSTMINNIAIQFIKDLLYRLTEIVLFCKRKTITCNDLQFISQITTFYPDIVTANQFQKLLNICINKDDLYSILRGNKGYKLYTLKNPFKKLVKELMVELGVENIHMASGILILLQNFTEHYIIDILNLASSYTFRDRRGTLLPDDIKMALKCKNVEYNEEL